MTLAPVIDVPPSIAPISIGGDEVLTLRDAGALPFNFQALYGSTVIILRGNVEGRMLPQFGSTINISGGVIGNGGSSLLPLEGSVLRISGGAIGDSFEAESGVNSGFTDLLGDNGGFCRCRLAVRCSRL